MHKSMEPQSEFKDGCVIVGLNLIYQIHMILKKPQNARIVEGNIRKKDLLFLKHQNDKSKLRVVLISTILKLKMAI